MRSMTGFGAANAATREPRARAISVETKSVNQRFLDLKLSLPKEYAPWEQDVRKLVQERVGRGRVELYVSREGSTNGGRGSRSTRISRAPTVDECGG